MDASLVDSLASICRAAEVDTAVVQGLATALGLASLGDWEYVLQYDADILHGALEELIAATIRRKRFLLESDKWLKERQGLTSRVARDVAAPVAPAAAAAATAPAAPPAAAARVPTTSRKAEPDVDEPPATDEDVQKSAPIAARLLHSARVGKLFRAMNVLTPAVAGLAELVFFICSYRVGKWESLQAAKDALRAAARHREAAALATAEHAFWAAWSQLPCAEWAAGMLTPADMILASEKSRELPRGARVLPERWGVVLGLYGDLTRIVHGVTWPGGMPGRLACTSSYVGDVHWQSAELSTWPMQDVFKLGYVMLPETDAQLMDLASRGNAKELVQRWRLQAPLSSRQQSFECFGNLVLCCVPTAVRSMTGRSPLARDVNTLLRELINARNEVLAHSGEVSAHHAVARLQTCLKACRSVHEQLKACRDTLHAAASILDGSGHAADCVRVYVTLADEAIKAAAQANDVCARAMEFRPPLRVVEQYGHLRKALAPCFDNAALLVVVVPPLHDLVDQVDEHSLSALQVLPARLVLDFEVPADRAPLDTAMKMPYPDAARTVTSRTLQEPVADAMRKDAIGMPGATVLAKCEYVRVITPIDNLSYRRHQLDALGHEIFDEAESYTACRKVVILHLDYVRLTTPTTTDLFQLFFRPIRDNVKSTVHVDVVHVSADADQLSDRNSVVDISEGPSLVTARVHLPLSQLCTFLDHTAAPAMTADAIELPTSVEQTTDLARRMQLLPAQVACTFEAVGMRLMHMRWAAEPIVDSRQLLEEQIAFARGAAKVTPGLLCTPGALCDVFRDITFQLRDRIWELVEESLQKTVTSRKPLHLRISHRAMCGASTVVRRVLHDLRRRVPVVDLLSVSEDDSFQERQLLLLSTVLRHTDMPVVVLCDNVTDAALRNLKSLAMSQHMRLVFVQLIATELLPNLSVGGEAQDTFGADMSISMLSRAELDALREWRRQVEERARSDMTRLRSENSLTSIPITLRLLLYQPAEDTETSLLSAEKLWAAFLGIDTMLALHDPDPTALQQLWTKWSHRVRQIVAPLRAAESSSDETACCLYCLRVIAMVRVFAPRHVLPPGLVTAFLQRLDGRRAPGLSRLVEAVQSCLAAAVDTVRSASASTAASYFADIANVGTSAESRSGIAAAIVATQLTERSFAETPTHPSPTSLVDLLVTLLPMPQRADVRNMLVTLQSGAVTFVHPMLAALTLHQLLSTTDAPFIDEFPASLTWLVVHFLVDWVLRERRLHRGGDSTSALLRDLRGLVRALLYTRTARQSASTADAKQEFSYLVETLGHLEIDERHFPVRQLVAAMSINEQARAVNQVACLCTAQGVALRLASVIFQDDLYSAIHLVRYVVKQFRSQLRPAHTDSVAPVDTAWCVPVSACESVRTATDRLVRSGFEVDATRHLTECSEWRGAAAIAEDLRKRAMVSSAADDDAAKAQCFDTLARFLITWMQWSSQTARAALAVAVQAASRELESSTSGVDVSLDKQHAIVPADRADESVLVIIEGGLATPAWTLMQLLARLKAYYDSSSNMLRQELRHDPRSLYAAANAVDGAYRLLHESIHRIKESFAKADLALIHIESAVDAGEPQWTQLIAVLPFMEVDSFARSLAQESLERIHGLELHDPLPPEGRQTAEQLRSLQIDLARLRGDPDRVSTMCVNSIKKFLRGSDTGGELSSAAVARWVKQLVRNELERAATTIGANSDDLWRDRRVVTEMLATASDRVQVCVDALQKLAEIPFYDDSCMYTLWRLLSVWHASGTVRDTMPFWRGWQLTRAPQPDGSVRFRKRADRAKHCFMVAVTLRAIAYVLHIHIRQGASYAEPATPEADRAEILADWRAVVADIDAEKHDAHGAVAPEHAIFQEYISVASELCCSTGAHAWTEPSLRCLRPFLTDAALPERFLVTMLIQTTKVIGSEDMLGRSGYASVDGAGKIVINYVTDRIYTEAAAHALAATDLYSAALIEEISVGAVVVACIGFNFVGPRAGVLARAPAGWKAGRMLDKTDCAKVWSTLERLKNAGPLLVPLAPPQATSVGFPSSDGRAAGHTMGEHLQFPTNAGLPMAASSSHPAATSRVTSSSTQWFATASSTSIVSGTRRRDAAPGPVPAARAAAHPTDPAPPARTSAQPAVTTSIAPQTLSPSRPPAGGKPLSFAQATAVPLAPENERSIVEGPRPRAAAAAARQPQPAVTRPASDLCRHGAKCGHFLNGKCWYTHPDDPAHIASRRRFKASGAMRACLAAPGTCDGKCGYYHPV